jgi:8-amino-7-oxononanoate synthase
MRDRSQPLELLRQAAAARADAGVRRRLVPRGADHDGLVDLASNDYLGLCGDTRLTAAAAEAAREWGTGSTGSRLVTGTTTLHARLEARLAEFADAAAALVFSSGYLANLTVLTALAAALGAPGDVLIVSDAGNHASLIDACRLCASSARARVTVTPHRDPDAVRKVLADRDEPAAIVVSDAVFSVDGAQAPVAELHAAAREHGALLVLDEAHAFGVTGPGGRRDRGGAGLAGQHSGGCRARGDGGRVGRRRSFPEGLCRLRCARWLLPAPPVPRGQACLRLAGRASLTESDFAAAARALAAVRDH